jgi:hypothetical protein
MFNGLLEEILNESAPSVDNIMKVLKNHTKVLVTYKPVTSGREHATGTRLIGVFAYGMTSAGNPCVRVFEYIGDTATFVPGWKLLRLDQFLTWEPTDYVFYGPPDNKFNPNDDRTMKPVLAIARFDDDNLTDDSAEGPKTEENLFMTPTEKELKKRGKVIRKQFEKPITVSDFKARIGKKDYEGGEDEYTEGPKTSSDVHSGEQTKEPGYKSEIDDKFKDLRDKLKNAPKVDLDRLKASSNPEEREKELSDLRKKLGDTSEPISFSDLNDRLTKKEPEKEKQPESYKDEVEKMFQPLKDKLKNAPKIDLNQFKKRKR